MKKQNPLEEFKKEVRQNIKRLGKDKKLQALGRRFMVASLLKRYSYNFRWLGRPIIQHPQDVIAMQELIWEIKPEVVVETGIAHGGSIIHSASILELMGGKGFVIGIDIDIRKHNRTEIEHSRMFKKKRIQLIEGSSVDSKVLAQVKKLTRGKRTLIFLDSSHAHAHVLKELELYAPLVSKGSYLVAFDTIVEYMPKGSVKNRPWDKGSNPLTAVRTFLKKHKNFVVDRDIENKLILTAGPGGFLKRIR